MDHWINYSAIHMCYAVCYDVCLHIHYRRICIISFAQCFCCSSGLHFRVSLFGISSNLIQSDLISFHLYLHGLYKFFCCLFRTYSWKLSFENVASNPFGPIRLSILHISSIRQCDYILFRSAVLNSKLAPYTFSYAFKLLFSFFAVRLLWYSMYQEWISLRHMCCFRPADRKVTIHLKSDVKEIKQLLDKVHPLYQDVDIKKK